MLKPWKDEPIEETIGYQSIAGLLLFMNPKCKDNDQTLKDYAKGINRAGHRMYKRIEALESLLTRVIEVHYPGALTGERKYNSETINKALELLKA